jgi:hypothetical protein
MYFHVWSPEAAAGVFIHIGRWPADLELWYGQVIALLPDGTLLADRSWGRSDDGRGPATGNVTVRCLEPLRRWRLAFDGAGEPTSLVRLAREPVGSGRAAAFGFEVELDAAGPIWDMSSSNGRDGVEWGSVHHVQGHFARGFMWSEGRRWSLDGVAVRDHSSGPRDVTDVGGCHHFAWVFPSSGRVVNGTVAWRRDGSVNLRAYAEQQDGECVLGDDIKVTGLADLATLAPRDPSVVLTGSDGRSQTFTTEVLHGYVLTMLEPNLNINGAAHTESEDPLFVTQSTVRVTAPDGEVGFGILERDYRRSLLPSIEPR